nr:MAG TPA: hypothetical protein [Caudoviricetes sp.]
MSSVKELEEKVKELMKEIEKLKQEKKNEEFEYPFERMEQYCCIANNGDIIHGVWTKQEVDTKRYEQGNIFKTKQEAIREIDKRALLTRFRQFRDKCNGDWKPEWLNKQERKYFMGYLSESKSYEATSCSKGDLFILFGYFKNQDDCKRAIELFGDEIIRLWVEE